MVIEKEARAKLKIHLGHKYRKPVAEMAGVSVHMVQKVMNGSAYNHEVHKALVEYAEKKYREKHELQERANKIPLES